MEVLEFDGEAAAPKQKKFACVLCRRRKLKCDGGKPKCFSCNRLGHACSYGDTDNNGHAEKRVRAKVVRSGPQSNPKTSEQFGSLDGAKIQDVFNEHGTTNRSRHTADTSASRFPGGESSGTILPLGLEESLPAQDLIDTLYASFH